MTILDFYNKNKGKYSVSLINKWLKQGYIRGSYIDKEGNWYIPVDALAPYTKNGNPKGISIYRSIVKGALKGLDVFAELYNMSEKKFDVYVRQLVEAGFLEIYESEGVKYLMTTITSQSFLDMTNNKIVEALKTSVINEAGSLPKKFLGN